MNLRTLIVFSPMFVPSALLIAAWRRYFVPASDAPVPRRRGSPSFGFWCHRQSLSLWLTLASLVFSQACLSAFWGKADGDFSYGRGSYRSMSRTSSSGLLSFLGGNDCRAIGAASIRRTNPRLCRRKSFSKNLDVLSDACVSRVDHNMFAIPGMVFTRDYFLPGRQSQSRNFRCPRFHAGSMFTRI